MKNIIPLFLLILALCTGILTGCSAINKDYYNVQPYTPSEETEGIAGSQVKVKNARELKNALESFVAQGVEKGGILFDQGYVGNICDDMRTIVQMVRTKDAICAYGVKSMTYEVNQIVAYSAAIVRISYTEEAVPIREIAISRYSFEMDEYILQALQNAQTRLAILVSYSNCSSEDVITLVENIYRRNPNAVPEMPDVHVLMFSGELKERLYEITFEYSLEEEEIIRRQSLLKNLDAESRTNSKGQDELHRIHSVVAYLMARTTLTEDPGKNTLYDALIRQEANCEGISLTVVQMVHELGMKAEIVYGQREGRPWNWNIVEIDGERYHLDVSAAITDGIEHNFINNDTAFWSEYRWDITEYEPCKGELTYINLFPAIQEDVSLWE